MNTTFAVEELERGRAAEEAGKLDAAMSIYQAALARCQASESETTSLLLRKIGVLHFFRGDYDVALNLFESAHRVAVEANLDLHAANALNHAANVRRERGELDLAENNYGRARALAVAGQDDELVAKIDQNLAIIANIRGDSVSALQRFQDALERGRKLGADLLVARVLNNMGMVYVDLESWDMAEDAFAEAMRAALSVGDHETIGTVQLNRAELYIKVERFDDARACCDQAFEIFGRLESKTGLGDTYKTYGVLYRDSGKLHLAEAHLGLVTELALEISNPLLDAEANAELALVRLAQGRNAEALRCLNRAHIRFEELSARRELVDIDRQLDKLESSYLQIVQVWGESIESKDHYTAGHCARVADYASELAAATGISGRELTWIRMGAFLHDVGKTEVDADVLNKQGPLSAEEWVQMRNHTIAGDSIVAELGFPYDIRPMVRSHHERWDGRGYPDQLAGEQIPVIARILCIADVFDALTTPRSYRQAFSPPDAINVMREELNGAFDPELFRVFESVIWPAMASRAAAHRTTN